MFYPHFITRILDNDPKGESGGTKYLVDYKLNSLGESSLVYCLQDKESTKEYERIYSKFQEEKTEYDNYSLRLQKQAKDSELAKKLSIDVCDKITNQIKNEICKSPELIEQYKSGNEKALNSLIGKLLKTGLFKLEPVLLKQTIINLL